MCVQIDQWGLNRTKTNPVPDAQGYGWISFPMSFPTSADSITIGYQWYNNFIMAVLIYDKTKFKVFGGPSDDVSYYWIALGR